MQPTPLQDERVITDLPGPPGPMRLETPPGDLEEMVAVWTAPTQWAVVGLIVLAACFLGLSGYLASDQAPRPSELAGSGRELPPIDLNRATRVELLQVPGVGENLADRILEKRAELGGFKHLNELRAVSGIGPARLARLAIHVTIGDQPTGVGVVARIEPPPLKGNVEKRIDINRATAKELESLPGIGPKLAARILAERELGPFESVDHLQRVRGIGAKTVEKLRPFVIVVKP